MEEGDDSSFAATKSKGLSLLLPCQENIFKLPKNPLPQRKFHSLAAKHSKGMNGIYRILCLIQDKGCIFCDFVLWYLVTLFRHPSSSCQFCHPQSLQKLAEGIPIPQFPAQVSSANCGVLDIRHTTHFRFGLCRIPTNHDLPFLGIP